MNEERCLWGCVCAGLSACGVLLLWLFESRTQPMEIGSSTIEMWCSIDVSLAGATRCATRHSTPFGLIELCNIFIC